MSTAHAAISHARNLELRKEHNIVGAFVNVADANGRTLAYCVTTEVRDFNGYKRKFFNVVTLDGRYISRGYKSFAAVTKWCRANVDEIAPEEPSNQLDPAMVETEDDISEPNSPAGRQAWSVVKLAHDAQKYATQAEEHETEAEGLALETRCYADRAEVARTEAECQELISEAKRHTALIAPEFEAAERLYRRALWAHRAAYRISSVMFFSDGPWDSVVDDWTEKSSDAHASALEARDRAEGAAQDAAEDVDRAEVQLNRACALCGAWYPCTRDGRRLFSDLTDSRGGYNCRCGEGESVQGDDWAPVEPGPGQMTFDDVPEHPEFPVTLTAGESVVAYEGEYHRADNDGYDWAFTTAAGHGYRLCAQSYNRGEWRVARAPFSPKGSSSGGWFWWAEIDDANDLVAAVEWCRKEQPPEPLPGRRKQGGGRSTEGVRSTLDGTAATVPGGAGLFSFRDPGRRTPTPGQPRAGGRRRAAARCLRLGDVRAATDAKLTLHSG
ncbi:hypothetical protein ACFXB3_12745 [Streptomyces sp. NPDC059447]|uniref:hypothetical protein n=1 Tax=Streptomyces sp. NPDC059447 TaxID=3346834 RepID=UPI003690AFA2